jgi:hypothetical protein
MGFRIPNARICGVYGGAQLFSFEYGEVHFWKQTIVSGVLYLIHHFLQLSYENGEVIVPAIHWNADVRLAKFSPPLLSKMRNRLQTLSKSKKTACVRNTAE